MSFDEFDIFAPTQRLKRPPNGSTTFAYRSKTAMGLVHQHHNGGRRPWLHQHLSVKTNEQPRPVNQYATPCLTYHCRKQEQTIQKKSHELYQIEIGRMTSDTLPRKTAWIQTNFPSTAKTASRSATPCKPCWRGMASPHRRCRTSALVRCPLGRPLPAWASWSSLRCGRRSR